MLDITLTEIILWIVFAWVERIGAKDTGDTLFTVTVKMIAGYDLRPAASTIIIFICFLTRLLFGFGPMLVVLGALLLQLFLAVGLLKFFIAVEFN